MCEGLYWAAGSGITLFWLCMCGSLVPFKVAPVAEISLDFVTFPSDTVSTEGEWWA